jgi:branched-chain amino acid transport system ATP-binding protein
LDLEITQNVWEGISAIEQKLTIAMAISDRVLVMGHGAVVFSGTREELKQNTGIRQEWLQV